jgi:predicted dehydrogenase
VPAGGRLRHRAERAALFAEEHADGGPPAAVFSDYREMLAEVKPDIVSVCTWPHLHAPMVTACAEAAGVRAVHCEKPMAPTWGEARAMAAACKERGVQLTFNHQRRFLAPFQTARRLLKEGAIGDLVRLEGACGDLFDWGTHWIDMFGFYNDDVPAVSVMGQVDARRPKVVYGVPTETEAFSRIRYANGVTGLMFTGENAAEMAGCANRLVGTEGTIEVHGEAPFVRVRGRNDAAPHPIDDLPEGIHGDQAIDRAIRDNLDSLRTGRTPLLAADNALKVSEIIFATYESARRRGRVDLPLDIEGAPFREMLDAGVFPEALSEGPVRDAVSP